MLIYPLAGQSRFCTKLTLLRNIELDLLFQLSQDWKFLKGSVSEILTRDRPQARLLLGSPTMGGSES